jgi:thioredoxin reductase
MTAKANVRVILNTEVKEIKGEKLVTTAVLSNTLTGEISEIPVNGVFVQVGESPNSQFANDTGIKLDDNGRIEIDIHQRTNLPGIYAAGDVTNHPVMQIGTAVGQGITAALDAYSYIKRPYYKK